MIDNPDFFEEGMQGNLLLCVNVCLVERALLIVHSNFHFVISVSILTFTLWFRFPHTIDGEQTHMPNSN